MRCQLERSFNLSPNTLLNLTHKLAPKLSSLRMGKQSSLCLPALTIASTGYPILQWLFTPSYLLWKSHSTHWLLPYCDPSSLLPLYQSISLLLPRTFTLPSTSPLTYLTDSQSSHDLDQCPSTSYPSDQPNNAPNLQDSS